MATEPITVAPGGYSAEYIRGYRRGFRDALAKVKPQDKVASKPPEPPAAPQLPITEPPIAKSPRSLIGKLSNKDNTK